MNVFRVFTIMLLWNPASVIIGSALPPASISVNFRELTPDELVRHGGPDLAGGSQGQVRIPRVDHTLPVAVRLLLPNLDVLAFVGGSLATAVPSEAIGPIQ